MHTLLKRQLKRHLSDPESLQDDFRSFIDSVNQAYEQFDTDRNMVERSLELSSHELLQANSEMRAVFQALPDLFVRLASDGTILDINGGTKEDFYIPPEKLIGKRFQDIPQKKVAKIFDEMIQQVNETKTMVVKEYSLVLNNEEHFYEARLLPLMENQIIGIVGKITERKLAEKAQLENEALLRATIDSTADGILVVDENGSVRDSNVRFAEMWHLPDDLLQTRDDENLLGHVLDQLEDPEAFVAKIQHLYQSVEESFDTLYFKDGRIFERYSFPLIVESQNIGRVWNFRDITERRKAEIEKTRLENQLRQSQKMEAIGTLAGGIAHDFNNILWVITGNTEISLRKTPKDNPVHSKLQEILTASNRAKNLVEQILTFSRKDEQNRSVIQIHTIAIEAVRMLESTLPATIEIRKNIDSNCGSVLADSTQIHQVIMNLGTNAYHAMENKNGVLEISLTLFDVNSKVLESYPQLQQGKYVELTVSDTGCGMDKTTVERIFEPFFTTKGVGRGTGLGLATVHGIVTSMGGTIKVYSEPGKGTTFRVFFPQIEEKSSGEVEQQQDLPDLRGDERIMIVDDEQQVVKMVQSMLEELNYTVTAITDSKTALAEFNAQPGEFDLVITDQTMPGMTGTEMADAMLRIRPDLPVILASGFSKIITENKIKDTGILEYLKKPIVFKDLEQTVRRILDNGK